MRPTTHSRNSLVDARTERAAGDQFDWHRRYRGYPNKQRNTCGRRNPSGRHPFLGRLLAVACASVWLAFASLPVSAEQLVRLRNGLILRGFKFEISSINQDPFAAGGAGEVKSVPIWMIDNGLRRVYIHKNALVVGAPVDVADLQQTIEIAQPVARGDEIQGLGDLLAISPLNEYGRRQVIIRGPKGESLPILQGITEINARYAKLEGLKSTPSYVWDMRLATSSLDSATLNSMFNRRLDMTDLDERLNVVRFFNEAERYSDAKNVLEETIGLFPEEKRLEAQIASITERQANQLLEEAKLRLEVGQPALSRQILDGFPLADVGRVTRIQVQDAIAEADQTDKQIESLVGQLRQQVQTLSPQQLAAIVPLLDELESQLSINSLARMSDYSRLGQSPEVPLDSRIALAICGWLLGNGSGENNLSIAVSLLTVREKVREYLVTQDPQRREAILNELRAIEGTQPEYISRMLPLLVPPLEFPEESRDEHVTGNYHLSGLEGLPSDVDYDIQLPPEYDPQRSYPCIVAIAPPGADPQSQIEWWAGQYDERLDTRLGLASRYGFIVVAPHWTRPGQNLYEFTPVEHARVLASLRDAMRRSQIDSDRVFLAGHSEGATAAWDIALAHPDLWAGMVSVGGEPRKTIHHYDLNAKYVPLYLLMGERDGAPAPLIRNGPIMNDYMGLGYDAMVVMYRGRGRENFYEDMPSIFDWLRSSAHVRGAPPREIETATMRVDDRFFWWLEMGPIKPPAAINPVLWDMAERLRAGKVSATVGAENQIRIGQGPSDSFTIWFSPEMGLDMSQRITVRYRDRPNYFDYQGDISVMLEDARTRADRKHPYWAKLSLP